MMKKKNISPHQKVTFWLVISLALGLSACAGPPDWVEEGSGAYNIEGEKALYGVGSIVGVKNEPLAWDAAENRARAEIAKNLKRTRPI